MWREMHVASLMETFTARGGTSIILRVIYESRQEKATKAGIEPICGFDSADVAEWLATLFREPRRNFDFNDNELWQFTTPN